MGNCTSNIRRDLLRVTRLGTGSVNKDRHDAEDEDDASAVDALEVVDWKPAGFKTDTATGSAEFAVQKEEKAARGPNDYRAFTVVCKVAKRPPIDLVVRPYETIDVIKRRLHLEHNLAPPEDLELLMQDQNNTAESDSWSELIEEEARIVNMGAVEGTVIRLVEHTSDEERLARQRKQAETPRRKKLERIQEIASHVQQGELFSPHMGREDVLNRTVPLVVGSATVPADEVLEQNGNTEVVRARKLSNAHESEAAEGEQEQTPESELQTETEVEALPEPEPEPEPEPMPKMKQTGQESTLPSRAKPSPGHFMGKRY